MQKLLGAVVLLASLIGGGWFVVKSFKVEGLDNLKVSPRPADSTAGGGSAPAVTRAGDSIRIASFNIQVFGESKAGNAEVMEILADVVRQFDVVAIQEVRSASQDLLPRFVEQVNATGRKYDFVIGPRLGRTSSKEQYAFVFDTASLEVDRETVYTVNDPDDLLHREPLVAAFRVRGPPPDEAFTFTLIDIHTDPDETGPELDALDDVFRAVRSDGRGEDDVILLGDLNVDERHLGELGRLPGIAYCIYGVPTNTRGTKTYDNIVYDRRATTEFTGNAGVFDVLRQFNLTMDQALAVSDHLPIWAEFDVRENGQPGRIAARPERARR